MANHLLRQANFSGGELAPLARGRVDLAAYATGLRLALNFLPTLEGPLLNRPGDRFITQTGDQFRGGVTLNPTAPRLIPFKFTDGQNFIIQVGDGYIRFILNGVQIQALAGVIPAWSNVTPYVAAGVQVSFGGFGWESLQPSLNQSPPAVGGMSNAFWRPLAYELVSPWGASDRLDYGQTGDVVTFVLSTPVIDFQMYELARIANDNWTLTPVDLTPLPATTFMQDPLRISLYTYDNNSNASPEAAISPDEWSSPSAGGGSGPGGQYYVGDFVLRLQATTSKVGLYVADSSPTLTDPQASGWDDLSLFAHAPSGPTYFKKGQYVWFKDAVGAAALYVSLFDDNTAPPSSNWALATDTTRVPTHTQWSVTAVWRDKKGRISETLASKATQKLRIFVGPDRPATIEWVVVTNPPTDYVLLGWRIYRGEGDVLGLVGVQDPTSGIVPTSSSLRRFTDTAATPDFGQQPPKGTNPFDVATGNNTKTQSWPGVVTNHEQRRVYARSNEKPQHFFGSAVNKDATFDINTPVVDSDTYEWRVASEDLEEIRHLVSLRYLLLLTSGGVFGAYGPSGAITPNGINLRRYSKNGASYLKPVIVENGAVYQTTKNRLRDLLWSWQADMYVGRDLSLPGRHLFDGGLSIVDMTYAETPFSLIYAPRSDGALLTLTYSPGGVSGWARHTTQGRYERVASCEEADPDTGVIEDAVYCVVKRTVNGATVRYIERFSSRLLPTVTRQTMNDDGTPALDDFGNPVFETVDDLRRGNFLDCSVEYDGRNTNDDSDHTFGIFSLIGVVAGQQVQLGTITGFFSAADIGKVVVLDPDAVLNGPYLFRIVAIAAGMATVEALGSYTTLAADFPSGFTASWGLAVTNLAGLDHLEGLNVSVLADGGVDGPFTVAGGAITLTEPAVIAQVGLPYVSDMETLDIAAEAVRTNEKIIKAVTLDVVASRGILVGQDFKASSLVTPAAFRTADPVANVAPAAVTGLTEANIPSSSTKGGRVCVRQVDPLPLSILAVIREIKVDGR